MTNSEIALELVKMFQNDIKSEIRHSDGDSFDKRKELYVKTYLYFLENLNNSTKVKESGVVTQSVKNSYHSERYVRQIVKPTLFRLLGE